MSTEFIENLSLPGIFSQVQRSISFPTVLISIESTPEANVASPMTTPLPLAEPQLYLLEIPYSPHYNPNPLSGIL
tara:strand:+ start:438 stop:662 length:225 start_codon:yes stop_codon:yes gene_type:complete